MELRKRLLMEKAERNAKKNYSVCQQIVLQILDFATKMAEYRELTEKYVRNTRHVHVCSSSAICLGACVRSAM